MVSLIFSNQGLNPLHLGTELEIIENEIEAGNDVRILHCESNLPTCFFNSSHNLLACSICEARSSIFYNKIGIPSSSIYALKSIEINYSIPKIKQSKIYLIYNTKAIR